MKELKQLLIDSLISEYSLEDATRYVEEAMEISIKGGRIKITYKNGQSNDYELIMVEKLKLLK